MTDLRNPPLEPERKMTEAERAIAIIEARLPLYTDIGQINALRECISSIRSSAPVKALETQEYTLRAMAQNYAGGHSWDHLDGEACTKAADEIKELRAEVSRIRSALAPVSEGSTDE